MHQHVVLCGLGRVGWPVLEHLKAAGLPVLVIDTLCKPDDPRLAGVQFIAGDCRRKEILEQAGLDRARAVLILTSDDLINISAMLLVRHLHPSVRVVMRLFNQNLLAHLGQAVPNVYAMSVSALTAPILALAALTGEALGTFGQDEKLQQVAELLVHDADSLHGRTIAEIAERHRLIALVHLPRHDSERWLLEVDGEARLNVGDRLIVCGKPEQLSPLLAEDADELLSHLRWASWLRRTGRIAARTFSEIDLPVKIVAGVMLAVVVGSTLVYHFGIRGSLAHGLFRTIGLIATGADMHEEELTKPWQKVFVSLMRLSGAALIAAFTAIFTNYLLRARLGKALEARRIPDGGHVVVCGLGVIGFRVAEYLMQRGEKVVLIEQTADARFVAPARRLGAAVVIGDATLIQMLRQVNADKARAVIAATDNQLANLEIALLVRELNAKLRVVLRLSDPYLAQTLREAANIRLAMSTSAMAAPAFVAALFGDRVLNIFLIAGKVLAVVELNVQAEDVCLNGQPLRALAIDYELLPVALTTADGKPAAQLANARLAEGDLLTAVMALPDLVRLLRRERAPAEWTVEVTKVPLPARPWLIQLLRLRRQLNADEAEQQIAVLPLRLGEQLTRGQAEDLAALCRRERVMVETHRQ